MMWLILFIFSVTNTHQISNDVSEKIPAYFCTDKEQGKTKHEALRSVNYKATQNKENIGTIALVRSVIYTTEVFRGVSLYKLHPGSRYNFQYKKYIKSSVRIMAS